jgi:hypothetical protein
VYGVLQAFHVRYSQESNTSCRDIWLKRGYPVPEQDPICRGPAVVISLLVQAGDERVPLAGYQFKFRCAIY